mgnify:CR=1 FL=1
MNKILSGSIFLMLLFAWVSSAIIGLSADEYFHHINGLVRYEFLISLGEKKIFEFRNNIIYPGLYDTLSYAISQIIFLINKKFYVGNIDVIMHLINVSFSTLSNEDKTNIEECLLESDLSWDLTQETLNNLEKFKK